MQISGDVGRSRSPTSPGVECGTPRPPFEEFVEARTAALLRFGWLLTADQADAEDLVQSALFQAWRRWPAIHRDAEAYVRRVMANKAARRWQRTQRRRDILRNAPTRPVPVEADDAAILATRESVRLALRDLPAQQRAVLVLRFFEDLSVKDTAGVLNCSEGTVKSSTSRALRAMRIALEPDEFAT